MFDSWEALPFCQHNHNYKYFIVCFSMFSYRQLPLTFDLSSGTWLGFFTSPPIGDRGNKGWFLLFHIAFLSNCVSSSVWANNRAVFCPCHSNLQLAWRLHWSLLAAWKKKKFSWPFLHGSHSLFAPLYCEEKEKMAHPTTGDLQIFCQYCQKAELAEKWQCRKTSRYSLIPFTCSRRGSG